MDSIFSKKGFIPYLVVMFINAGVDLGHKITIQNIILKYYDGDTLLYLSLLVNAMILFPFIFLFSPSGFLNDKFSKTIVTRVCAIIGVLFTFCILISYIFGWFYIAFIFTLFLAMQSAIYSPAKYGLIKNLLGSQNLGSGNGVVQAVTIVSILLNSFMFSIFFEMLYSGTSPSEIMSSVWFIGVILFVLSIIEAYFTFKIPYFKAVSIEENFEIKKYLNLTYLNHNLKFIKSNKSIFLCILGLSVFWAISQIIVATFPAHYKAMTMDSNVVIIQVILSVSAIGIIIGSAIAASYSKKHIELGIVPFGALGISMALFLLSGSKDIFLFALSSLIFGISGGVFIVPLNAAIQYFAKEEQMGKILSGNNFLQNITMVFAIIFSMFFVKFGLTTIGLYLICAMATLFTAIYCVKELPHLFSRILLLPILKQTYKVNVNGLDNLPLRGGVLLLGNHISWIDWLVLQIATPRPIKFVMFKSFYNHWYIKWFFNLFKVIPIGNGINKSAIEAITKRLNNGEVVALFPEGRISYNGHLGEFQQGFELAAKNANCVIIPFFIRGLWGSTFSRASKGYKELANIDGNKQISVTFGKQMSNTSTASAVKKVVNELSFYSWGEYVNSLDPVHFNWINVAKSHLFRRAIVDSTGLKLNNLKFITLVLVLFSKFKNSFENEKHIGVILPSSVFGSAINLLLLIKGKVIINLNYTVSEEMMIKCVQKADIKSIITSRKFVEKLADRGFNLQNSIGDKLIYLEDIAKSIEKKDKILAFLKAFFMPAWLIKLTHFEPVDIGETATIVFSSGSEGEPKGIKITHRNLMANIKQIAGVLNKQKSDVIMATLPLFHSFGITVTTFLPLTEGIMSVHIPDPTDSSTIGNMAAKYNATILLGTSTFFRLYNKSKKINSLMFANLRIVVAGAEKLKEDIKKEFKMKFGHEIYEGYGTTETTPVVSCNMPNSLDPDFFTELVFNKPRTVGLPLPGTVIKIVDPKTLEELDIGEEGLILIGGHQVMEGYYDDMAKTSDVIVKIDGIRYYKSGDIGLLDKDGFLKITDRVSRFAKIGGEMISLASVEEKVSNALGEDIEIICVSVEDEKKGEKIVLLYKGEILPNEVSLKLRASHVPPLMLPSSIYNLEEMPLLGSGKVDLKAAKNLARALESKE
ncbi:acyl-[ACP]--phospholipid O-acyltransferase [Campylobacter sp. RM12327]|uniref:acyl-[ACP]--phospholipid O-acyltransferase n=1 Tax=Campylobacter sputorum TaxID=206 RepID=UPI000B79AF59|nr:MULTISPECIES: acyl-[ACP]--phospholipid O-acyltransferase [Campylobacter]ASM39643.1 2-acylglycerophosphoethanolamine acyltransferase / acyl-[acp] synthetase [Campylobacter sputorum]MBE7358345.1 acyl-[ACP]--phospholipid O-acyltransferase [Campylobacter sp. RM11302]MBF6669507.1 acyl-[ACP]--phospholipid O-acyltransferase [Campylobacter sp. RM12327]MBF6674750.1 acyl-[ACP]--phospholipid O-acyltransferase [Campylobacter sp. RM13538]MBF6676385.1 acyl-[ACP]--phospholipid O-acyltransferase [Campyloba